MKTVSCGVFIYAVSTFSCGLPGDAGESLASWAEKVSPMTSTSVQVFQTRLQEARTTQSPSGRTINREEVRGAVNALYENDSQIDANEQAALAQWMNGSSYSSSVNASGKAYAQTFWQLYGTSPTASVIQLSWQDATPRLGANNELTVAMKVFEATTTLAKPNAETLRSVIQQGQANFEGGTYAELQMLEPVSVTEIRTYLTQFHSGTSRQRRADVEDVVMGLRATTGAGAELYWASWSGFSPWAPSAAISGKALFASNASTGAVTCVQFETYSE